MLLFLGLSVTTFLIAAVISIAICYWYQIHAHHYWKRKNVPSENPSFFPWLSSRLKRKNIWDEDQELCKKHGKICGFYFERSPALMVSDPDLLRFIFVKDFSNFTERKIYRGTESMKGKMLNYLQGEEWKRVRSILTPIFTSGKLRKMAKLVNKCGESASDSFLKFADNKTPVELKKQFGAFALNVIATTAFGTELDVIKNPDDIFAKHANIVLFASVKWKLLFLTSKILRFLPIDSPSKFFRELVLKIREQRINGGEVREDFLQMLLDIEKDSEKEKDRQDEGHGAEESDDLPTKHNFKKSLTPEELVAQCVVFFAAGSETTGTTLSMVCYLLALNPECQKRLLAEVDETWEKQEGKMDSDIVGSMKYLDAVMAETLRLYPPVTRLKRNSNKDYVLGDTDIAIPKGMIIYVPIMVMHRDPEHFPQPEKFDPERFLPENKDSIKPYTYLPFGSGPRNCIAMRFAQIAVKLALVNILRHVSFHKCPETETRFEFNHYDEGTLFQPKSVTVGVKRRR